MSIEIQWNDIDPVTGRRRYLRAVGAALGMRGSKLMPPNAAFML